MARLALALFRRAGRISPHLATLLPVCRTIESAQLELRWIRQHVVTTSLQTAAPYEIQRGNYAHSDRRQRASSRQIRKLSSADKLEDAIAGLVARRGDGEPLQYVLGSQPFADLEILCEKGVLIPRPETEAWVSRLADILFSPSFDSLSSRGDRGRREPAKDLRILDLCSGTGCISLSLYARGVENLSRRQRMAGRDQETAAHPLRIFGFDIEPRAVRLARKNLAHNFRAGRPPNGSSHNFLTKDMVKRGVTFRQADIFTDEWMAYLEDEMRDRDEEGDTRGRAPRVDLLVSNPPYISQRGFEVDTARSVRNYEPKIALVPPAVSSTTTYAPEDLFYKRLLDIADALLPRVAIFEVGDMKQAIRVVEMALARSRAQQHPGIGSASQKRRTAASWDIAEIWRDSPDSHSPNIEENVALVCDKEVPVRGIGHGRVVFLKSAD